MNILTEVEALVLFGFVLMGTAILLRRISLTPRKEKVTQKQLVEFKS